MQYRLLLLACCLAAWSAPSQSASIERIDVTAFGIMAGPPGVRDGVSSGGIVHRNSGSEVVATTTKVPACLGTRFGIVFSVAGEPDGMQVNVDEVYKFPPSGVHKPDMSAPIHETRFESGVTSGTGGNSVWYEFDDRWEQVPGKWTFELRDGNRVLASKSFTVVLPKRADCQRLSV